MDKIKFVLSFAVLLLGNILITQKIYCQSNLDINKVIYRLRPPEGVKDKEFNKEEIDDMLKFEQAYERVECELYYTKSKSVFTIIEKPLSYENLDYYVLVASLVSNKYYLNLDSQKKICYEEFRKSIMAQRY
ncbi:hypothetical protein [Flavobacterium sp. FlaQc-48]|uniref:hypothetical protein n=1 Tax=Flavobacterium sp. FlaQc-48 TaxID=3374181 RepID=UPI003756E21E